MEQKLLYREKLSRNFGNVQDQAYRGGEKQDVGFSSICALFF